MNKNNKDKSAKISREAISQKPLLSFWDRCNINDYGYRITPSRTQLVFDYPNRVSVCRNPRGWLFDYRFLILGIIMLICALYFLPQVDNYYDEFELGLMIPAGLLLIVDGVRYLTKKFPTFDKKLGWVWLGRPDAKSILELQELKKRRLNRVVAIQMIEASKFNGMGLWKDYWLYELNIVFDDLQRMNIQCHGQMSEMSNNGKQLAEFLEVPFY